MPEEIVEIPDAPNLSDLPSEDDLEVLLDSFASSPYEVRRAVREVLSAAFKLCQTYDYQRSYTKYLQKLAQRARQTGRSQTNHIESPLVHDISSDAKQITLAVIKLKNIALNLK